MRNGIGMNGILVFAPVEILTFESSGAPLLSGDSERKSVTA
jgi:hypothetical protein